MATTTALKTILAAAQAGRVSASSARSWGRRAAAGESVAILDRLEPVCDGVAGEQLTRLASDLVSILATGGTAAGDGLEELPDDVAGLWPPRSGEEADQRHRVVQAARKELRDSGEPYDLIPWPWTRGGES